MQASFLDLSTEIRLCVYDHVFHQSSGEIHGLRGGRDLKVSNEDKIHPAWGTWDLGAIEYADEVMPKAVPKNAWILRTCRLVHREAASVFYGSNTIALYAEDNDEIYKWMLKIGESNRLLIRHLEIGWAYGVDIVPKSNGWREVRPFWTARAEAQDMDQLERQVTNVTESISRSVTGTFELLAANQKLLSLAIYIPGVEPISWATWRRMTPCSDNFQPKICSQPTTDPHACLPNALGKMLGIKALTIGYTKDLCLVEEIAKAVGVEELVVRFRLEYVQNHDTSTEEWDRWAESGWQLESDRARKSFGEHQLSTKTPGASLRA